VLFCPDAVPESNLAQTSWLSSFNQPCSPVLVLKINSPWIGGFFNKFLLVSLLNKKFYSIKSDADYTPYTITLKEAKLLIETIDKEKANNLWFRDDKKDISIINGRYGAYIKKGKTNYKISKKLEESDIKKLTLKEIEEIISKQDLPNNKKKFKRR